MKLKLLQSETPLKSFRTWVLAMLVGIFAGLGAVVFRLMIGFFHNLLLLGQFSFLYNANQHTPPSPWGPFVILVPVIGAAAVVFLVTRYAPEAKGHGVPEVIDALYYKQGKIRLIVAVIKSLASAICIGTGGPMGREGPIIQIGGSVASSLSQVLNLSVRQRLTLVAAGAAGGIAATFNTPVGGILFAVELMLLEISVETLVPVAIAVGTATYISRLILGPYPSFIIPSLGTTFEIVDPRLLLLYAAMGIILGLISAFYTWSLYTWIDVFERRLRMNYWVRHLGTMALMGVVMYLMITYTGHYYVQGLGYATIQDILNGTLTSVEFLILLFLLKLWLMPMTLGSGASGGIFSPSLFMGATLGSAFALIMGGFFPDMGINPVAFAVAGMAGVVGGATGAAITAIVMLFEMTRDYHIIIPLTITVAIAYGVRKWVMRESIYTMHLKVIGHPIPGSMEAYFPEGKKVKAVMNSEYAFVPADGNFKTTVPESGNHLLVVNKEVVTGVITASRVQSFIGSENRFGNLAEKVIIVPEELQLSDVFTMLRNQTARAAVIVRERRDQAPDKVIGMITIDEIEEILAEESDIFNK